MGNDWVPGHSPSWAAVVATVIAVAALGTGAPRMRWLLKGAPLG